MEENKNNIAPDDGPDGVDRWSSNGYGVTISDTPKKDPNKIDEIEEE